MQKCIVQLVIICCGLLCCFNAAAQAKDSIGKKAHVKSSNIFKFAMNVVTRSVADTGIISSKGETPFLPYKDKIIRYITVKQFGFDQSFTDTAKKTNYFGTKLLNHLHRKSKSWVIRNNLFIKENTVLNPYKVADNERYLRSLSFIQDARILVKKVAADTNYVDVEVVTKDLFSISGSLHTLNTGNFRGGVSDVNAFGMGQTIALNTDIEGDRSPHAGYSVLYNKINVAGSFINFGAGYSTMNIDLQNIALDEHGAYVTLQRPLPSQYSHVAGGVTFGRYQSYNSYATPLYKFYNYGYNSFDAWIGYNLSVNKYLQNSSIKDRRFISIRHLKNDFYIKPFQTDSAYNFRYNDRDAILAQFTFFRQDFYKTNYIYGFGNTEDVPNGYNIALTTGWYKQADLNRAYAGIDANLYRASSKSDFIQYFARIGGFLNKNKVQDAALLVGTSVFSRLIVRDNIKFRHYFNVSYSRLFNRVGLDPLNLNNVFGLRNFNADSVMGVQRLSFYTETFVFLKYKVFGFKFAPFVLGDASMLTPENKRLLKSDLYYGIGGGIRARNENLVFNTIQLRFVYFPRSPQGNHAFKLTLTTNLNFRYNSVYVSEPDVIQLNADANNGIY